MSRRTNRELVMLATVFDKMKHRVAGMYLSEKLDGQRCLWLPHTRGVPVKAIPFANRDKDKREHIATGLWTRYGKVIHCPDYFVQGFPDYPLDGELFLGQSQFQGLMKVVKELIPDPVKWKDVRYLVFDAPQYSSIFQDGRINNPQYSKTIVYEDNVKALNLPTSTTPNNFDITYRTLDKLLVGTQYLQLHQQRLLPFNTAMAMEILTSKLEETLEQGGEGLILRHPASMWEPIRSTFLQKVTPLLDAEATVVSYRMGQGKFLGMLGSLTVSYGGIQFELSGFKDEERTLTEPWYLWGNDNPGRLCTDNPVLLADSPIVSNVFPVGSSVTFQFREHSEGGVPKSARYKRKRED